MSIDKGPGMQDPSKCLRDGYSSAGTSGTGLGAITRFSLEFDLFSGLRRGTVLLSQLCAQPLYSPPHLDFKLGAVCIPFPGKPHVGMHGMFNLEKEMYTLFWPTGWAMVRRLRLPASWPSVFVGKTWRARWFNVSRPFMPVSETPVGQRWPLLRLISAPGWFDMLAWETSPAPFKVMVLFKT